MIETLFVVAMVYAIFAQLLTEYRIGKEIEQNRKIDSAYCYVKKARMLDRMRKMVKSN